MNELTEELIAMHNEQRKAKSTHVIISKEECNCEDHRVRGECVVCDWGLDVCKVCGEAEVDLYEPCKGAKHDD